MDSQLLPSPSGNLPSSLPEPLPQIIHRAGANAVFAAQEFFFGSTVMEGSASHPKTAGSLSASWQARGDTSSLFAPFQ
jgi:hypothetical protein